MRRVVSSVLAVASFALLSACEKKPDTSPAPMPVPVNAPTARATESAASPTPGADAASGAHDSHMANCPTAAPGATVAVKDVEGGVEISITGKDEPVTKEIRARMAKLVEADKNEVDAGVKHTSKGEGGGRILRFHHQARTHLSPLAPHGSQPSSTSRFAKRASLGMSGRAGSAQAWATGIRASPTRPCSTGSFGYGVWRYWRKPSA